MLKNTQEQSSFIFGHTPKSAGPIVNVSIVDNMQTSSPEYGTLFAWIYNISIKNIMDSDVSVLSRRWSVINEIGIRSHIIHDYKKSDQVIIKHNESVHYGSIVSLRTQSGMMYGEIDFFVFNTGETITVDIFALSLDQKDTVNHFN